MVENLMLMPREGKKLFFALIEKQHKLDIFLFNMVNKPLDETGKFSLILGYNSKSQPTVFFLWDSFEEKLYGPYEAKKEDGSSLIIEEFKWVDDPGELYVYYVNKETGCLSEIDSLHSKPVFELV